MRAFGSGLETFIAMCISWAIPFTAAWLVHGPKNTDVAMNITVLSASALATPVFLWSRGSRGGEATKYRDSDPFGGESGE